MKTQLSTPTPVEVRAAREAAGLTQAAAGALVHVDLRSWQRWESGERGMNLAYWELFQIKTARRKK
ncbi:helix-turn-helix domain-containing protein [Paraburkholderia panacisoli]|uniref:Helix-turn-helix domain-containing protein n=1 Tax=Paraburkholderia panacisoli TaxID=2603818 RepID=A0A5B0HL26_9BURK|nr:helix-turn-helix domain-containing protein [Paraburkholderia panacisoli]KAA1015986.1 helix-turn-helix domain-containing protein [Paraburkholderia panacisoli]